MRWRPFLLYHFAVAVLFFSWFFSPTSFVWGKIDSAAFHFFNGSLANSPLSQIFWALANVKLTDLFGALFMASFSMLYIFEDGIDLAKKRLAQFFYLCLWWEIGILVLKGVLFPILSSNHFLRESPSLLFSETIQLSTVVPWLKVKDFSHWSFPADHAFIIFQWAGFIAFFCGFRYGLMAYISSCFFILPRLIAGAHWLSDIFAGSLALTLIFLAWATATPLYPFLMHYLELFSSFLFRWSYVSKRAKSL